VLRHGGDAETLERMPLPIPNPAPGRSLGLDLLRATAILMVLANHWASHFGYWFGFQVPPVADAIGDTGVEIFFALSGFLIGRILIGIARARPTWSDFLIFMTRRAIRTLPLYFLWLALLLAVFPPTQDALVTALRCLTLSQNLVADMPPDYFYAVTWSLTIEEWFYLLFGALLLILAQRFGGRRALSWCLVLFLLIPLALRLGYQQRGPLVFLRIDEIAYGVLMARLYLDRSRLFQHPWPALIAGLLCIAAALTDALPLPDYLSTPLTVNLEVIGGALCLPAALRLQRLPSWLRHPVRWLAARSYALYLMHLTILVDIAEHQWVEPGLVSPLSAALVAVVLPFPLAELSYRLLEAPLQRLRPHQNGPQAALTPGTIQVGVG
jgi:peptidoglycan/LPS O-acetylase OafA/YrhL